MPSHFFLTNLVAISQTSCLKSESDLFSLSWGETVLTEQFVRLGAYEYADSVITT